MSTKYLVDYLPNQARDYIRTTPTAWRAVVCVTTIIGVPVMYILMLVLTVVALCKHGAESAANEFNDMSVDLWGTINSNYISFRAGHPPGV